jgi:hypothetical protein
MSTVKDVGTVMNEKVGELGFKRTNCRRKRQLEKCE